MPLLVTLAIVGCSKTPDLPPTSTPIAVPMLDVSPTAIAAVETPIATATAEPPAPTVVPLTSTPEPVATNFPQPSVLTPIGGVRRGGTLTIVSREGIAHQDVQQEVSPALATWGPGLAYSRLLRLRTGPDVVLPSLAVECELCESWEMPDETTFLFRLRDDVIWQDISPLNGRRLVAADLVFSYERQRTTGWPNAPLLAIIDGMEATEDLLLRITVSAADADFLATLADGHSKVVAREAVELSGDLKDGPTIGTGPWILAGSQADTSHAFERNAGYFEAGIPLLERLNVSIIEDEKTRTAAFRTRVVDVQQMEPAEWAEFRVAQPGAPLLRVPDAGTGLEVALKTSAPPFDDARVRRAALLATDPWAAIDDIWLGSAFVSLGLVPVDAGWLLSRGEMQEFFGRPTAARDLLEGAGVELPVPVQIKVGDFGQTFLSHADRIAEEMRAVGFAPELELMNRRRFGEEVWLGGDYQMFAGPIAPMATPNGYLLPVLHSQGAWNTAELRDPGLDSLIERQAGEYDPALRAELARLIQRRVFENAYRFMPATRISIWTWWPRVRNFHPNFAGSEYAHWSRVWVER